ncbi:Fms-interacting protein-domain-containing protein [Elsinoe ampelina]|uniref:Fms-interacting protein-domain-containing protein n=1 Tax=Elsinoe ampelina TaxID=302913 RepID=A0A6A6G8D8_9PEZI|nr:Fms-interacting protein-domain-containing protein [Elsinoe ampelina]
MDTSPIDDENLTRVLATAQQTRAHCLSLLQFLEEHKQSSSEPSQEDALALSRLQKQLTSHLSLLRGHHRRAVYSARLSKSDTAEFKSEIDSLHLSLQNLFYEQRHLLGEIQGCEDYPHSYTSLSLQDEEAFLDRMVSSNAEDGSDKWAFKVSLTPHEYMVARIKDEKEERQRLEKERQELLKKKAELTKRNEGYRKELEKVDKEVETWLEARSKVEKLFEDKLGKEIKAASMEMDVAA